MRMILRGQTICGSAARAAKPLASGASAAFGGRAADQTRLNDAPNLPSGLYSASHSQKDFRTVTMALSGLAGLTESDSEPKYGKDLRSARGFSRGGIPGLSISVGDLGILTLRHRHFYLALPAVEAGLSASCP